MPSFFRVVPLGFLLPSAALSILQRGRPEGPGTAFGQPCRMAIRFEPKIGGGGHVLFIRDGRPDAPQRLLVEPHPRGWVVAAILTEAEYRRSDESYVEEVRRWLLAHFELRPEAEGVGLGVRSRN